MDSLAGFTNDKSAESEGVWHRLNGNTRVRLSRAGGTNKKYKKAVTRVVKARGSRDIDIDDANEIERDLLAKQIIKGWQTKVDGEWKDGIEPLEIFGGLELNENGLIQPAREYFKIVLDALPDIAEILTRVSNSAATFRAEELEELSGN